MAPQLSDSKNGRLTIHPHRRSITRVYTEWRFTVLLAIMALLNFCRLVTLYWFPHRQVLDLCAVVVFAAVTLSLSVKSCTRIAGLILGLPAIVLLLVRSVVQESVPLILAIAVRASCAMFLALVIGVIIVTLLQRGSTNRDSIAGAFCGYLLIGVMFAELYCMVNLIEPHSFRYETAKSTWDDAALHDWLVLEYFSFVSLTTVGFGDVVPVTPVTRFLAAWEAIFGQFYLAVLVAGLVNLRASEFVTNDNEMKSRA